MDEDAGTAYCIVRKKVRHVGLLLSHQYSSRKVETSRAWFVGVIVVWCWTRRGQIHRHRQKFDRNHHPSHFHPKQVSSTQVEYGSSVTTHQGKRTVTHTTHASWIASIGPGSTRLPDQQQSNTALSLAGGGATQHTLRFSSAREKILDIKKAWLMPGRHQQRHVQSRAQSRVLKRSKKVLYFAYAPSADQGFSVLLLQQ